MKKTKLKESDSQNLQSIIVDKKKKSKITNRTT